MTNDQARIDLAVAFRWAARLNLHEGVANSFCAPCRESSFAYPGYKLSTGSSKTDLNRIEVISLEGFSTMGWCPGTESLITKSQNLSIFNQ